MKRSACGQNLEAATSGGDHEYVLGQISRIQRDVYDNRRKISRVNRPKRTAIPTAAITGSARLKL